MCVGCSHKKVTNCAVLSHQISYLDPLDAWERHRRGNHGDEWSCMKVMGSRGYDDLFVGRQRADLRTKQGGWRAVGGMQDCGKKTLTISRFCSPTNQSGRANAYHRRTVAGNSCSSPCVLDVLMAESLPPDLGHVCVSGVPQWSARPSLWVGRGSPEITDSKPTPCSRVWNASSLLSCVCVGQPSPKTASNRRPTL
jgi:hypothetical protein